MTIGSESVHTRASHLRSGRASRFFFVALGLVFVTVAAVGFGPNQLDHIARTLSISAVGEAHGVLMAAWLFAFIAQAAFVATKRIDLHRRFGIVAIGLGVAVWLSIVGLTIRQLLDPADPLEKRIDSSLPQLYVVTLFLPLFVAAIRSRRNPAWHKRLVAIAMVTLLQPAVDRFRFLPDMGLGYWPQVACLDVLLSILVLYDLASSKRVHPATLVGSSVVFAGQSAVAVLYGAPWWPPLDHRLAEALQRVF